MTRVVIEDPARPGDALVLMNRSASLSSGPATEDEWYLRADGLSDEWYAPPESKAEVVNDPSGDGAFWPDEFLVGQRVFTIRGGLWSRASSVAQGAARARLARLHNRPLRIMVEDEQGARWIDGFMGQRPIYKRPAIFRLEFSLVITCPDPVKVGRAVPYAKAPGQDYVIYEQPGDVPTWPLFRVGGPVTVFTASYGGHLLAWEGNAPAGVTIDPKAGTVKNAGGQEVGGIVVDDVFMLPPGRNSMGVVTDSPNAVVEVRPGWL